MKSHVYGSIIMRVYGQTMATLWPLLTIYHKWKPNLDLVLFRFHWVYHKTLTFSPRHAWNQVHTFIVFHGEFRFKCNTCLLVFPGWYLTRFRIPFFFFLLLARLQESTRWIVQQNSGLFCVLILWCQSRF